MKDYNKVYTSLPHRIRVRVNEDRMGNVTLNPTNDSIRDLIDAEIRKETADLYGYADYAPFYQEGNGVYELFVDVPQTRYRVPKNDYNEGIKIGRYTYEVNDNNIFYISTELFFNLMGIC